MKFEPTDLNVDDKTSFIKFLILLKEDFIKNGESWENQNLPDFLEAIALYCSPLIKPSQREFFDSVRTTVFQTHPAFYTPKSNVNTQR